MRPCSTLATTLQLFYSQEMRPSEPWVFLKMKLLSTLVFTLLHVALVSLTASAQQVPSDPTSSHIFPAGGQRGTQVAVRVGGECLPPLTRFKIFGEGLTSPELLGSKLTSQGDASPRRRPGEVHIYYPKEWNHSIDIGSDAALGMHLWRLACARGGTGGRPFIVGDLPEYIERESNSTLERAEAVNLPITLNGQIDGERDLDYFQFELAKDALVSIDVVSRRLGSPLETVVEIYDGENRRLSIHEYRVGSDPVLTMRAPKTGIYRLMLGHLGFQGGPQYVYRATLSTAPYVAFTFPSGAPAGADTTLEAFKLTEREPLESFPIQVALPAAGKSDFCVESGVTNMNRIPLLVDEYPTVIEAEPNDSATSAQKLPAASCVYGRFLEASDEDFFQFQAEKGSLWSIDCQHFPLGGDCLPIVTITNSEGAPLAMVSSADDLKSACRVQWQSPESGNYAIRMRDIQQGVRGGPDFIYRLSVAPAVPGFELSLANDFVNVVQGAKAELDIKVKRSGGFAGPIDLQLDGLPEGIRCEATQIAAGQDAFKLTLSADDKARSGEVTLRLQGTATHNDEKLLAHASALHLGRDSDGVAMGSPWVDHIQLTVRHKPVLRLFCNEAYQYAYRGSVYPYAMEIERLNGFTGPVHIELADRQIKDLDGIVVHETTVPENQTKFDLSLYLPESMHINVQAHSNVYAQAYVIFEDDYGQKISQCFVSEMRCMIRPLPTVVKLACVEERVMAKPGDLVSCKLRLDRTSVFRGPMKIELLSQEGSGIRAEPVVLAPEDSTVSVAVQMPAGLWTLPVPIKFRATGELPGYVSIISETDVTFVADPAR